MGLPLDGYRVLDYSQYVAGPLATMLLADLGADVIKVESPRGDAWRHYAPHAPGESTYFYSLNRNKRSVVLDLKTPEGLADSERLVRTADALVHNLPPARAKAFRLDPETVRRVNPRAVCATVSGFGSSGPDSDRLGYDLIAQAMSGLLLADARVGDAVPRRSAGIPMADIISGLLTCVSVLAGLNGRHARGTGTGIEVSLLGAALTAQIQQFVRTSAAPADGAEAGATAADLADQARQIADAEAIEPYYRCYATADGFLAVGCLNVPQRLQVLDLLALSDAWVENPQAAPAHAEELAQRTQLVACIERKFAEKATTDWVALLTARNVPVGPVRRLDQNFDHPQARANGLVQTLQQPGIGEVQLLGNVFKLDETAAPPGRPAPGLGEHTAEVLASLPDIAPTVAETRGGEDA